MSLIDWRFAAKLLVCPAFVLQTTGCDRQVTPLRAELPELGARAASHELSTLARFNEQPWNDVKGEGWNYLRRTASKDSDIVTDDTAPLSADNALRITFTPDMRRDSEPGVHWLGLPSVREVYAAWSVKWSPGWTCSPAGCGKIAFFRTRGEGTVYMNYGDFGRTTNPKTISINTHWAPYGERVWASNRLLTQVTPGKWYRLEWHCKYPTNISGSDGTMRWWVDGILNGEYTDMQFPYGGLTQFEFAPTLQNAPPVEQYMYIDHTVIKIR